MYDAATTTELETGRSKGWNYRQLMLALITGFVLQSTVLPCLCQVGEAKTTMAGIFDTLMLIRILAAKIIGQTDRGWIFYVILMYSSPLWIETAAMLVLGRC